MQYSLMCLKLFLDRHQLSICQGCLVLLTLFNGGFIPSDKWGGGRRGVRGHAVEQDFSPYSPLLLRSYRNS